MAKGRVDGHWVFAEGEEAGQAVAHGFRGVGGGGNVEGATGDAEADGGILHGPPPPAIVAGPAEDLATIEGGWKVKGRY
jgi:hypothetical protein